MEEKIQMLAVWNGEAFRKPRLPKAFSWVVGVQRLSERFADVPQFDNVQVWFDDHPVERDWKVTMSRATAAHIPQQIFTVWYSVNGEPHWYFRVFPVESERRASVLERLEEQAFPAVEKWMKTERPKLWLQADKYLRCIWDRINDRIDIKEGMR